MTLVILIGEIDLAVGAVLAFSATLTAYLLTNGQFSTGSAFTAAILSGVALGFTNGIVTTGLRIPSFVVALAMMSFARGLARLIFGGVMRYTAFGRHVYAIGGNSVAAPLSEVRVDLTRVIVFALCGALTAFASFIHAIQLNQGALIVGAVALADVESLMTQKVDALIISPNEAAPLTAVVKRAYDKGIPVIVLDRNVLGEAYTMFIGADNKMIGKKAGEYVAGCLHRREEREPGGGQDAVRRHRRPARQKRLDLQCVAWSDRCLVRVPERRVGSDRVGVEDSGEGREAAEESRSRHRPEHAGDRERRLREIRV